MSGCGIPTFTCLLVLLFMAALYASARSERYIWDTDSDSSSLESVMRSQFGNSRSLPEPRWSPKQDVNKRGRQGRIADSGGHSNNSSNRQKGGRKGHGRRPRPGQRRGQGEGNLPFGVSRREMKLAQRLSNATTSFVGQLLTALQTNWSSDMAVSPFSAHMAVTMISSGARKATQREIMKVLGLQKAKLRKRKAHLAYHALVGTLTNLPEIFMATGVYIRPEIPLEAAFRRDVTQLYGANFDNLHFDHPQGPQYPINSWISNKTRDIIQTILPQGSITPVTTMVLVNAIYFKIPWQRAFPVADTRRERFYSSKGGIYMDMMRDTSTFYYANHYNSEVVRIPYIGGRMYMYIILPHENYTIAELISDLTVTKQQGTNPLAPMFKGLVPTNMTVILPKFKVDSRFDLISLLNSMGIRKAFHKKKADFSGISAFYGLKVDAVIHRAVVEVSEEGSDTATDYQGGWPGSRPSFPIMKMNMPFLFVITDSAMRVDLFMGVFAGHSASKKGL